MVNSLLIQLFLRTSEKLSFPVTNWRILLAEAETETKDISFKVAKSDMYIFSKKFIELVSIIIIFFVPVNNMN